MNSYDAEKPQSGYQFWDNSTLINGFNQKNASSFFNSETYFLKKLDKSALRSTLDVGCSCGRFIELLSANNIVTDYCGLDISEKSIDKCKQNYPQHRFFVENFLNWNTSEKFTLVNATGVVQHEKNYQELIRRMINTSDKYVLFDVKLANISKPMVDINTCYCEYDDCRIEMICFSLDHLISALESSTDMGEISVYGYSTPPNKTTTGPASIINHWASCGVFIDKSKPFRIAEINVPSYIR